MPESREYEVDGIRVQTYGSAGSARPPLLFVHGGGQGSWAWERIAPRLAEHGWYGVCLNWYGHNGSRTLPAAQALTRSIADVTHEIGAVAAGLPRRPVLVGHSMGGLASAIYAAAHPVDALVLITPVVPARFAGPVIPLDVDTTRLWSPPAELVDGIFWDKAGEHDAYRYRALACPESPRAVREATRWLLDPDLRAITAPVHVFAASEDTLTPAAYVGAMADALGATYTLLDGEGHGVPQNPVATTVADRIGGWLRGATTPVPTAPAHAEGP